MGHARGQTRRWPEKRGCGTMSAKELRASDTDCYAQQKAICKNEIYFIRAMVPENGSCEEVPQEFLSGVSHRNVPKSVTKI